MFVAFLTLLVYRIFGPLLVFYFLEDEDVIVGWLSGFLPSERPLLKRVWHEMDDQICTASGASSTRFSSSPG